MAVDYRNSHPYWYYKYVQLAALGASLNTQIVAFQLKNGFDYWIRGLIVSYPHSTDIRLPDDISPPIRIELLQYERNRQITEIPIPIELCTNPAGIQPQTPGHAQENREGLHNGYTRWNYLISDRDVLYLRVSNQSNGQPEYVRIVILGQNVRSKLYD